MTSYRRFNKTSAAAAFVASLALGACSAQGDVDTSGDGVTISGDLDTPVVETTQVP